ncbi:MAG: hypothetical protein US94_C0046G0007 [Berkelbacteria bacterium GW2011_GWB1_38_5]|nr:MAG: hypothetical protein US94_C0046G0007 [Berkelbacteria bacterium GW2011_GWB1_38_5]
MSRIPHPREITNNTLPNLKQIQQVANLFLESLHRHFPGSQFVLFGSLVRGDATIRSDIDICAVSLTESVAQYDIRDCYQEIVDQTGWWTKTTFIFCASRRVEKEKLRFKDAYNNKADFSPTTFDHFGFLSRNSQFPAEIRQLYENIQQDVRKYSKTDTRARLKDLTEYVNHAFKLAKYLLEDDRTSRRRWFREDILLPTLSNLENLPYHCLRKLAGIVKTFQGTDSKAKIRQCFENPHIPFFAELL